MSEIGGTYPAAFIGAAALETVVLDQLKNLESTPVRALLQQGCEILPPPEQARGLRVLMERVDYETDGKLTIALNAHSSQHLAEELGAKMTTGTRNARSYPQRRQGAPDGRQMKQPTFVRESNRRATSSINQITVSGSAD